MKLNLWHTLLGLIPGEIDADEGLQLVAPFGHAPLLSHRRGHILIGRVRMIATLFALLTPLWILVDLLTLPAGLWQPLALLRVAASAAFVALARSHHHNATMMAAYRAMAWLFAIPTVFYVASLWLLFHFQLSGLSAAIGAGYAYLPFVLLAGLAVFPLALLESALFALPVLVGFLLTHLLSPYSANWATLGGELWLLALLSGVAAIAGVSQLAYIIVLVKQAVRDPLTGVFSRRSGEEILALMQAQRQRPDLSLAFFDLDHFKDVNDRYGHQAGDRVLCHFASQLDSQLRRSDVLVRWGGEEFLLLLPGTSLHQARALIARLQESGLGERPDGRPLTASIGLAEWQQEGCQDWRQLVEIADIRMYRAKQQGRNRLIAAEC
ncbi:diguanylate cyclase [Chromobacterium sp. IIBBL 290-4]|uniref:GGDEF domain-containing protein n=1 Tax=Chromobacterium sp. IIBBL 290-4 TaxID=2953890 RepID=UPI0020B85D73|nr:GGDEF domain-containing protein [Chromobacterium sp. IIBBL 290-4]UTH76482.1 GGDEF domain-containing protein [Chromobacterium sp. IIBBL 290-4]